MTKGTGGEYFTTHPTLEVRPDEDKMTIGISCVCDRGESIVMASDMRATYGTTPIGPNDACGKVFRLGNFNTMVCVAGSLSSCHAVISQMVVGIRKLSKMKKIYREHVINAINHARIAELQRVYNWSIHTYLGISLHEWATGKVPGGKLDELIYRAGAKRLEDTPLKVELIVAGFIQSETMFFKAARKEPLQEESSPGVYAIGIGDVAAMKVLNRRGQRISMSLARTLLHVHEAMRASRRAHPRLIGSAPVYLVMRKSVPRTLYISASAPILESWRRAYSKRRNTASLDDSKIAAMDIYHQLQYLRPVKDGM